MQIPTTKIVALLSALAVLSACQPQDKQAAPAASAPASAAVPASGGQPVAWCQWVFRRPKSRRGLAPDGIVAPESKKA